MKKYLLLIILTFFINTVFSQNAIWKFTTLENLKAQQKSDRETTPIKFDLYTLNFEQFKEILQNAPLEGQSSSPNLIIPFPNPDGEVNNFKIYESPMMDKELGLKYPNIKTYSGYNVSNPTETIRFSVTLLNENQIK